MSKVKLSIQLNDENDVEKYELIGIFNKKSNILSYIDNNKVRTKFDFNKKILYRESDEYTIVLFFTDSSDSYIFLKDSKLKLDLKVKVINIKEKNNQIYIKYIINEFETHTFFVKVLNYC